MIEFRMIGLEAINRRLEKVDKALKHKQTINTQALTVVDRWVQENFRSQGGKVGGWKPLSAQTLKGRREGNKAKGRGSAILQDKGWLKSKWEHIADDNTAILRSRTEYGIFHNSDEPRHKLPQRRILPRNKEVWPQLERLYSAYLKKILND